MDIRKIKQDTNPVVSTINTNTSFIDKMTGVMSKDIQLFGTGLNDQKKEAFYLELNILLTAGVDIRSSLQMIVEEQEKAKDKELFNSILEQVVSGDSLSGALEKNGKFSSFEFHSIRIGEETGRLPIVLQELCTFYQKKVKQRRQLVSALTYPAIVLTTSFGAVFFMLNFIVPMFAGIYQRFGGELPWITAMIVSASEALQASIAYIFMGFMGIFIFLYRSRNKEWYRKYSSKILLNLPLMGKLYRKIYLARFCHSMSLLISSRIPLIRSLNLVGKMVDFYPIEESLASIEEDIMQGETLYKSLSKFSFYPSRMISLLKVGEEVNKLDVFFEKIAQQYNDEVEHQTQIISSMIEPIMILFLGVVVGFILIAMYLPLFQLSTSF
jgi:type IV pilus assembly protein PilC